MVEARNHEDILYQSGYVDYKLLPRGMLSRTADFSKCASENKKHYTTCMYCSALLMNPIMHYAGIVLQHASLLQTNDNNTEEGYAIPVLDQVFEEI